MVQLDQLLLGEQHIHAVASTVGSTDCWPEAKTRPIVAKLTGDAQHLSGRPIGRPVADHRHMGRVFPRQSLAGAHSRQISSGSCVEPRVWRTYVQGEVPQSEARLPGLHRSPLIARCDG